jgi:hypothetical protein
MWQSVDEKQWWSRSVQERRAVGSAPSWASVADPENEMVSPTFHRLAEVGFEIVGTGGELPAVMVTDVVPDSPWGSVTRSLAVTVPGVLYVHEIWAVDPLS